MTSFGQIIWLLILGFGERIVQWYTNNPNFKFDIPENFE